MIDSGIKLKKTLQIELKGSSYWKILIRQQYTSIFIYYLRRMEYYFNKYNSSHCVFDRLLYVIFHTMWRKWSLKTGITIPKNVCEEGLTLYHYGSIVVNPACRIGRNCCIMNNVNIGANGGSSKAPQIGNNVYIGPGAIIYGDIKIADGCYIGANSVVNKSFLEPNSVVVGVPSKVIGVDEVCWWKKNRLNLEEK